MYDIFNAIILGIVEGITEFIPVSSTGHLILTGKFLGREGPSASVFDVVIQVGAILAVIWVWRVRVFKLAIGFFTNAAERLMGIKIILAFLPAAIVGVLAHDFIKHVLFSPLVVAISLIVGGIVMLIVERAAPKSTAETMDDISVLTAFKIGLCQLFALIPGVSRAGASIVGAQFLGASRIAATQFSFFLAIPTIIGASVFDLAKNMDLLTKNDAPVFIVGTLAAFLSAMIVIKWLIAYVSKYGFTPFAYYRIIFGTFVLILLGTGVI